ncbi:glutathione S-transferase [Agrobacterium larrymoorei]|uniref:Glutathione S-transferase n=1 Tax=Agrobacterium larrymoorei TaxID=160699 RepID=A0A4D7E4G2_9HYPH|nr:glutathione S-transferase [Agrobacterium larrymoorei]QCI99880.1 glutathione S-transferase [Agrobacterium larrymoorei]QYA09681.1 glutathione S-transferase [Agrobacterium larrymoorei]
MLKIWGRINSTNVRKVLWVVEELDLVHQRIDAGGAFGLVNDPAYRAMNPNGLVPVIQDGDDVLWESNTIVRYLATRYGDGALNLTDPIARAQAEKWMDWATSALAGTFRDLFWGMVRTPEDQRDMAKINTAREAVGKLLRMPDEALARQDYLSGDTFGIGDIPLGCFAYAWFEMPIERPALPNLEAWYQRLKGREAYQRAVMTPLT